MNQKQNLIEASFSSLSYLISQNVGLAFQSVSPEMKNKLVLTKDIERIKKTNNNYLCISDDCSSLNICWEYINDTT